MMMRVKFLKLQKSPTNYANYEVSNLKKEKNYEIGTEIESQQH